MDDEDTPVVVLEENVTESSLTYKISRVVLALHSPESNSRPRITAYTTIVFLVVLPIGLYFWFASSMSHGLALALSSILFLIMSCVVGISNDMLIRNWGESVVVVRLVIRETIVIPLVIETLMFVLSRLRARSLGALVRMRVTPPRQGEIDSEFRERDTITVLFIAIDGLWRGQGAHARLRVDSEMTGATTRGNAAQ